MKLRVLKEEGETTGGISAGVSNDMGSVTTSYTPDNTSVGSNIVNYGGRSNPYLSNLAEYEHKNKKRKQRKYEIENYNKKKDNKNAGHKKAKKKTNKFHESWYE